jgi:transcriptional regulator with XRE-family HTH domain
MLAPALVVQVQRLLEEGKLSQRSIARHLGISRGTVHVIASGQRPDYEVMRRKEEPEESPQGPPQRCPICGGWVYLPCRACRVRENQAATSTQFHSHPMHEERPRLQLRPEHQARYEQVQAWRRQAAALIPNP